MPVACLGLWGFPRIGGGDTRKEQFARTIKRFICWLREGAIMLEYPSPHDSFSVNCGTEFWLKKKKPFQLSDLLRSLKLLHPQGDILYGNPRCRCFILRHSFCNAKKIILWIITGERYW
ncbi:hypothetical protein XELAEV_18043719mg [Xenopus laevis]|uniref:Uncharacterized protein n=1 Tax=Xenopus laevis TaxID=8355 RepID=A0A974BXH1_XENLA|nr:hypothetical protein XELAEV_18043719mg [Xenopus laevis]